MINSNRLGGSLMPFLIALTLSLVAFMTEAKALTVAIGPFSSGSGSIALSGTIFGAPVPGSTDAYSFTLTDNAKAAANFNFVSGLSLPIPLHIDLYAGAVSLAHTTATEALFGVDPVFGGPIVIAPAQPGLFSLVLAPGNYVLGFSGAIGNFSGTLAFSPLVATTPIPAALPLFAAALGGLGFVGWRREKRT